FARQQLGQLKEAEQRYWFLIKTFHDSSLVPDCHLAIGEMSFDRKNFKHALEHFNAIKNYPDSRVYPYGLYKSGWTYYNLRDAMSGLKELEKTVDYGKFVTKSGIDSRLDLRREALADMTIFFEEVFPSSRAWNYFSKQAEGLDMGPYIIKLAKLYERHSRFKDVILVLKDFVNNLPNSELRPEVENRLILASEEVKDESGAVAYMESFYKVCEPEGRWDKSQRVQILKENSSTQKPEQLDLVAHLNSCQDMLSVTSLRLASRWYKAWRKDQSRSSLADNSQKAFEIHLRRAKPSEEAYQARFLYAELLFQLKKYREASLNYETVGLGSQEKNRSHDALYSSLLSLEKAVGDKWNDSDETRFTSLVKHYVSRHPQGKQRLDLEFKMALIAYEKAKYLVAAPVFLRLGSEFHDEEKGKKSQDLYLDILNLQKDYDALKSYAASLRKTEKLSSRLDKLTNIYEQAYFMGVQLKEEKGQMQEALDGYQSFAKENPNSELAEQALWNTIQIYFRMPNLVSGARACEDFQQRFPKSKKSLDALLRAAQTYEQILSLVDAARVLRILSKVDIKSSSKWKSLSADYLSLSGRREDAIKLYEELRQEKDSQVAFHALEQLEILYGEQKAIKSRESILKAIAHANQEPRSSLAHLELLEATYREGKSGEAFNEAKKLLSRSKLASRRSLARARFIQAEILAKEFELQSVKSRADRVAMVLGLKTSKLEKAQQAYQSAIKYGDPGVTVDSLERLSDLYRNFVDSLRNMPLPEGLEARDEPVFRDEMEKLAIPLEEKSVDSLAQSLAVAKKLQLRDGSVARLQEKLNKANMVNEDLLKVEVTLPNPVLPELKVEVGS
ncbi:MAG: hypothetical protein KDD35_02590, partial [Bdellovibrionales bacterium]|nr:hypothetical protein [Bdellovibrionales bacterium]